MTGAQDPHPLSAARAALRPAIVAAAFDIQMVPDVPLAATDLPVNCVVTDNAIYTR